MAESAVHEQVCCRCNTSIKSQGDDWMEKCPNCGAFLVTDMDDIDPTREHMAMVRQIDGNFPPEVAAAVKKVLSASENADALVPSVARVSLKLIPLLQDESVDMIDLSNLIEKDQTLVANILRVANSAYYQGRGTITKVNDALVRLGLKQVQSVILATISRQMHLIKNDRLGPIGDKLWYHAVASSFACRELAQTTGTVDPDEAYSAGLLHDIGRAVVLRAINELMIKREINLGDELTDKVTSIMDFLHVRLGVRLLESWQLPEVLITPARYHHSQDTPKTGTEMVNLVKAIDELCIVAGFSKPAPGEQVMTEEEIAETYGFDLEELIEIRDLLK